MPHAILPVTKLIKEATYWSLKKGRILATIESPDGQTCDVYPVHNDELRTLHPLLPEALEATILKANRTHVVFYDGESQLHRHYVNDMLQVLRGDFISFTDTGRSPRKVLKLLSKNLEPTGDAVYINGHYCETGLTQVNGQTVPYIITTTKKTREVTADELEKNYPGWLARLRLGKQLEVDRDALLQYVFTKPTQPANITGLNDLAP